MKFSDRIKLLINKNTKTAKIEIVATIKTFFLENRGIIYVNFTATKTLQNLEGY